VPFVVLVPAVVLAVVVAIALGVPDRRALTWGGGAVGALVVLTGVSVAVVVIVEGDDDPAPRRGVPVRGVDVVLEPPVDDPFADPDAPVAGMADGDTLLVRLPDERRQTVHQCPADRVQPSSCAPGIPAPRRGDRGGPVVLVEVSEEITPSARRVDCREQACVLAAFDPDGRATAVRPLAFGDATPPARVMAPAAPVVPGEAVTVRLRDLPPGAQGAVTLCVPGPDGGAPACGAPAPEVPFEADREGAASVELAIETGPVAGGAGRCERRSPCAIGVVGAPVPTRYVPVRFSAPPGPDVPAERLAAGLATAGLLAAAAVLVVRRNDWSPPGGDPFAGVTLGDDPFAGVDLDDGPVL
jgi:hypothetical protein